jgi:hypothetical protein
MPVAVPRSKSWQDVSKSRQRFRQKFIVSDHMTPASSRRAIGDTPCPTESALHHPTFFVQLVS